MSEAASMNAVLHLSSQSEKQAGSNPRDKVSENEAFPS